MVKLTVPSLAAGIRRRDPHAVEVLAATDELTDRILAMVTNPAVETDRRCWANDFPVQAQYQGCTAGGASVTADRTSGLCARHHWQIIGEA